MCASYRNLTYVNFSTINSMVRVQKRIFDGLDLLQFFTTRQWDFRTERLFGLYRELSPRDQEMYVCGRFSFIAQLSNINPFFSCLFFLISDSTWILIIFQILNIWNVVYWAVVNTAWRSHCQHCQKLDDNWKCKLSFLKFRMNFPLF